MKKHVPLILRLIAAIIILQTLPFKLLGDASAVALFTQLGVEPWGRYLTAILELTAGILLLIPTTAVRGAYLTIALMFGALGSHILILGFDGNMGELAVLAIIALISSMLIVFLDRPKTYTVTTTHQTETLS